MATGPLTMTASAVRKEGRTVTNKNAARGVVLVATMVVAMLAVTSVAGATGSGAWGSPVNIESIPGTSTELNTPWTDGCPIQSPDGLSLYMASNRDGYQGTTRNLDIWVAHRPDRHAPWGAPENLGPTVNGPGNDFCPSPTLGGVLFFVSDRVVPGACGGADIYVTRSRGGGWAEPTNLGCSVNSAGGEASPSFVLAGFRPVLYFSSARPGGFSSEAPDIDSDIYLSRLSIHGFGPAELVPGVNTSAEDSRPNVRSDGREMVFDSTRPGTLGGPDLYATTRTSPFGTWGEPVNLGPTINTPSSESRASLSWDGRVLVFGSNRPGSELATDGITVSNDLYVAVRYRG
jgi:hypothetical protein